MYPLFDEKTLYGSMYCPTDGNVDPSGLCTALTRFATKNGARVIEDCPVTGIKTKESTFQTRKVSGIETANGFIQTPVVVNCTGRTGFCFKEC